MDVSIIIVNYNTRELTRKCIESIFNNTYDINFEIILVDNNSTDGSIELFSIDKRIIFVESGSNLGFGKANNLGYKYSRGKYIFLLNSDTIILNNAIKIFYEYAEQVSDTNIGCLGTLLLDEGRDITHSYGKFPNIKVILRQLINQYTSILGFDIYDYNPNINDKYPKVVDYITGADLFIRRDVIEKYGLFNPKFFMYYEETELQYRYNKNGILSVIIEKPQIVHLVNKNKGKRTMKGLYIATEGCFTYCKLILNSIDYYIVRFLFFVILIPKIIFFPTSLGDKIRFIKLLTSKI